MSGEGSDRPSERDEVRRLLDMAVGPAPIEAVNWQMLHHRVMRAAESEFQSGNADAIWWRVTARWSRVLVPLSAAAAIIAAVLVTAVPDETTDAVVSGTTDTSMILQAAAGDPAAETGLLSSIDRTDSDWLLSQSVLPE